MVVFLGRIERNKETPMSSVNLTPQQEKIANHIDGSLIVLAGAGAGKTATLVERVGRMLNSDINPRNVLVLTFSRKAAKEVKTRIINRFGYDGEDVTVDTFHGFGYRFVRQYKDLFGLTEDQDWAIMTESEQKRLLNELAKPMIDDANADGKAVRRSIKAGFSLWSLLKQNGICPGNVSDTLIALEKLRATQNGATPNYEKVSLEDRITAQTLVEYEKTKKEGAYLDFDDLLLLPTRALSKYPDIANGLGQLHRYIMVDESQDTNAVQYLMVRSIGKSHGNVVMVGDDDQSIYGWRGARVANLRQFMKDFSAPVARLEQNFRSHSRIVECAHKLIQHNNARLPKKPFSEQNHGPEPVVETVSDGRSMANAIVEQIQRLSESGASLSDIAILYRTNRMTTLLEPALKQAGIPYSVVGGMSFYERSEIQAVMAVVRIANKFDDWQAIKSLQPYIDGLGKKGMGDTIERLKDNNENLLTLAIHEAPQQFGKGAIILQTFLAHLIQTVHYNADKLSQYEQLRNVVQWVKDGPMKLLDREKSDEQRVKRSDNLDQLLHEVREANPKSYVDYLMEGPISDYVTTAEETDHVTLSTIHRSKGLEWPHVMIAGASHGLMPLEQSRMNGKPGTDKSAQSDDDDDGGKPEEERRLAYVGATRAAYTLRFFHAHQYHFPGGEPVALLPSPFLSEMGLSVPESPKPGTNRQDRATQETSREMEYDTPDSMMASIFN